MTVRLIWTTPNPEQVISDLARISNPANQGLPPGKLLASLIRRKEWSPFEMASACFEIETTRDIARQILRHRSFSFQEFSQRYAVIDVLDRALPRPARMQDHKDRQNSIATDNSELLGWWEAAQEKVRRTAEAAYQEALAEGIAKEVARAVLPEGLTTSRMYMAGNVRSWMHYCGLRCGKETQIEHREIARAINDEMLKLFPVSWAAMLQEAA